MQVVIHVDAVSADSQELSSSHISMKPSSKLQHLTNSAHAACTSDGIKAVRPKPAPSTPPTARCNSAADSCHMTPPADECHVPSPADTCCDANSSADQPTNAVEDLAQAASIAAAETDIAVGGIPSDAQESVVADCGTLVDAHNSNIGSISRAHEPAHTLASAPKRLPVAALHDRSAASEQQCADVMPTSDGRTAGCSCGRHEQGLAATAG